MSDLALLGGSETPSRTRVRPNPGSTFNSTALVLKRLYIRPLPQCSRRAMRTPQHLLLPDRLPCHNAYLATGINCRCHQRRPSNVHSCTVCASPHHPCPNNTLSTAHVDSTCHICVSWWCLSTCFRLGVPVKYLTCLLSSRSRHVTRMMSDCEPVCVRERPATQSNNPLPATPLHHSPRPA